MTGKPPTLPPIPTGKRDLVELRIENLQHELAAEEEPRHQAALLYEIGSLYEHQLRNLDDASETYGRACTLAPDFQPAWIAKIRLTERGRDRAPLELSLIHI